ncbi:Lcl C-terminal domain-containing protein [Allofranklinella schreckenbergeri]|nr:DUF1566 domain-containing protein [Allofranklinella schreckenbergeri]MDO4706543.1 DUF1566 domain-containing protein [Comamonadaceae bacterium]
MGQSKSMAYEQVSKPGGGFFMLTECVRDKVSGLLWEGKTNDGGLRDGSRLYTNWGDGRAGDASAYVAQVNAMGLCGFDDWRLPTVDELQSLVDYRRPLPGPAIDAQWFPHTWIDLSFLAWRGYWASELYVDDPAYAWNVNFNHGTLGVNHRNNDGAVRLVRSGRC